VFCSDCGRQNRATAKFCIGCGAAMREFAVGEVIHGRYKIETELGTGAMGVVYRVHDEALDCPKALKVMVNQGRSSGERQEALARFAQEAKLLALLHHPGLPRVQDFFVASGRHCLVQDFIEGVNLEAYLSLQGRPGLPEQFVKDVTVQILAILDYLHSRTPPVLYRDLKPSNVMMSHSDGRIVLIDFGIARRQQVGTGTSIGTDGYAPPEQYIGRAEPRSDLYALAATMYHLLTGEAPQVPFQFEPLAHRLPGVGSDIADVVHRALNLQPDQRYASAGEMRWNLTRTSGLTGSATGAASQVVPRHALPTVPRLPPPAAPPVAPVSVIATPPLPATTPSVSSSPQPGPVHSPVASYHGHSTASPPQSPTQRAKSTPSGGPPSPPQQASPTSSGGPHVPAQRVKPAPSRAPLKTSAQAQPAGARGVNSAAGRKATSSVRLLPLGQNSYGYEEFENPKDRSILVLIPGGPVQLGSDECTDEMPLHTITLPAYYIGKSPVTIGQFRAFADVTGHVAAGMWELWAGSGEDVPVTGVSWWDAAAYCKWAGLRLPTEAEWEKAARGSDGRRWPWGDRWDPTLAICECWFPEPVSAAVRGLSPYGCVDMAGNVTEWCASRHWPYPYRVDDGRDARFLDDDDEPRVHRGGAYSDDKYCVRCASRNSFAPDYAGDEFGFRCAR